MLTHTHNLRDAGIHRESEVSRWFGDEMRCIGPVCRGTPLALRRRMTRRSSGRCSHPSGIGASRRRAPELDSKVSHPFSNPGVITAPLIGTVFHTRHDIPDASSKSRLAMPNFSAKKVPRWGCQAQSTSIGVVSVHERSVRARSVLFITKALVAHGRGAHPAVPRTACELTTGTPRAHGIGPV